MLSELHIENIAVIKSLDIGFGEGFTVFTGQTGAGKSIIVNSLRLLSGEKTKTDIIRSGQGRAFVSAVFTDIDDDVCEQITRLGADVTDGELLISRQITSDGKSVCRCGRRQIPAYLLKDISSLLLNIHGQHASQQLLRAENHLEYLDAFSECDEEKHRYRLLYNELAQKKRELSKINTDESEKRRMTDFLSSQIKEIDSAKLKKGEETALQEQLAVIKNADKLAKHVKTVYRALSSGEKTLPATSLLELSEEALRSIYALTGDENAQANAEKLAQIRYDLLEIADSATHYIRGLDTNPKEAADRIQSRLEQITVLKRKYGSDIDEILQYRENIASQLKDINESADRIIELKKQISILTPQLIEAAEALREKRRVGAGLLAEQIEEKLRYLDMKKVRFEVGMTVCDAYAPNGADKVEFLISANAGQEPKPLSEIASGGELSRTMLAIKSVFGQRDNIGTVFYDEIDTGISGGTSEKIGYMLSDTAQNCQVIAITHSAQIASCADSHCLIYKDEYDGADETRIKTLDDGGRTDELSRIMGGEKITDATKAAAKEMIENNRRSNR